jgi:hypothetical protein
MQPVAVTVEVVAVGVTAPHASAAVAVPRAALMSAVEGLQPRVNVVPLAEITGAIVSRVHVMVLETLSAALLHASAAFHVLV